MHYLLLGQKNNSGTVEVCRPYNIPDCATFTKMQLCTTKLWYYFLQKITFQFLRCGLYSSWPRLFSKGPKALSGLKLDKTSANYKLSKGLTQYNHKHLDECIVNNKENMYSEYCAAKQRIDYMHGKKHTILPYKFT